MFSWFHFLFKLLSHYVFLDFSWYCQGILSHELDIFWNFVMGNATFAVIKNLFCCHFVMFQTLNFDDCNNLLTKFFIRNSNNLSILHSIHFKQKVFNLLWIHVFTSSDDHIFFSSDNWQVSFFIKNCHITWFHPSILNWFLCCSFISPVWEHDMPAFGQELSGFSNLNGFSVLIDDFGFHSVENSSDCGSLFDHGVGWRSLERDRGSFSHSLDL